MLSSGCFVGPLSSSVDAEGDFEMGGADDPDASFGLGGDEMDVDQPTSSSSTSSRQRRPRTPLPPQLVALKRRFGKSGTTRPLRIPVPSLPGEGLGNGTLLVPGWIRERVAEGLFDFKRAGEDRDEDRGEEASVVEVVLAALLKVSQSIPAATSPDADTLAASRLIIFCSVVFPFQLPIDLRLPLASTILLTGGTASLPGFLPRLRSSLIAAFAHDPTTAPPPSTSSSLGTSSPTIQTFPPTTSTPTPTQTPTPTSSRRPRPPRQPPHPYAPLLPLSRHISLLNDPNPPASSSTPSTAGSAPAFAPSLLGWIGGSLAGALRVGSSNEVTREVWDEAREGRLKRERQRIKSGGTTGSGELGSEGEVMGMDLGRGGVEVLGDWTRW